MLKGSVTWCNKVKNFNSPLRGRHCTAELVRDFCFMEISEKEIEDFIYNDLVKYNGNGLMVRGVDLYCFSHMASYNIRWFRQLNIEPYGICDIVGFYRFRGMIYVELIELKKTSIDANHFEQIARYKKGLQVYLKNTFLKSDGFHIDMSLIGIGYDGCYIQNLLPINVYNASFDLNGFTFDKTGGYSSWYNLNGKNKSFRNGKV